MIIYDDAWNAALAECIKIMPLDMTGPGNQRGMLARARLYDARAEIAVVNEFMSSNAWRGAPRRNACTEPCDNWNGPCVCGAWHKDGK